MKLSLTRRQRAMLLFLSAAAYTAWFSGVGERGEAQGFATQSPDGLTIAQRRLPPRVASVIVRDPFAGKPVAASNDSSAAARPQSARSAARSDLASSVGALAGETPAGAAAATSVGGAGTVPNIGADPHVAADTAQTTLTLALRATIVGPRPVAYVENGTVMDIVRVGDTLGDRRVARIDLRGIAFTDGSRLDLPQTYLATPAPAAQAAVPAARALTINDLRRLLLPVPQTSPAQPAGERTPQAAPTSTYPTPGPLPTVNTQGLPVGVNPTPNPYNPTPYAYPYPYAPPR